MRRLGEGPATSPASHSPEPAPRRIRGALLGRAWYKGHWYRSELAADWARALDTLGLEWVRTSVLHDGFFLPASQQQLMVCTLEDGEVGFARLETISAALPPRRLTGPALLRAPAGTPDVRVVMALPGGRFIGFATRWIVPTALRQCLECGGWWFHSDADSWHCQVCGAGLVNGGNDHVSDEHVSQLRGWPCTPEAELALGGVA